MKICRPEPHPFQKNDRLQNSSPSNHKEPLGGNRLKKILKVRDSINENCNSGEINLLEGSNSGEGKCIREYRQRDYSDMIGATTMKSFHEVIFQGPEN
jgi:hypothetical protein